MAAAAAQMLSVRAPAYAGIGGLSAKTGESQAIALTLKRRAGLAQRSVSVRPSHSCSYIILSSHHHGDVINVALNDLSVNIHSSIQYLEDEEANAFANIALKGYFGASDTGAVLITCTLSVDMQAPATKFSRRPSSQQSAAVVAAAAPVVSAADASEVTVAEPRNIIYKECIIVALDIFPNL